MKQELELDDLEKSDQKYIRNVLGRLSKADRIKLKGIEKKNKTGTFNIDVEAEGLIMVNDIDIENIATLPGCDVSFMTTHYNKGYLFKVNFVDEIKQDE